MVFLCNERIVLEYHFGFLDRVLHGIHCEEFTSTFFARLYGCWRIKKGLNLFFQSGSFWEIEYPKHDSLQVSCRRSANACNTFPFNVKMELDEVFVFQDFQGLFSLTLVKRNTNEQFLITWLKMWTPRIADIILDDLHTWLLHTYGIVPGEMRSTVTLYTSSICSLRTAKS